MQRQEMTPAGTGGKLAPHPRTIDHRRRETQPTRPQESPTQPLHNGSAPILVPCLLRAPDGTTRPGWELRLGEVLFGRADSQETLLQYYARIHEPMPSGHWRERVWQPNPPRGCHRPRQAEEMDEAEDELLEEVLEEEEL